MGGRWNHFRYGTGAFPPEDVPVISRRAAIEPDTLPTTRKVWELGPVLNQKGLAACAAFATTAELIAEPQSQLNIDPKIANEYGKNAYKRARVLSGWPPLPTKQQPTEGSVTFRNMEVSMERGLIENYRFYRSADSSVEAALHELVDNGPIVLTMFWPPSFDQTNRNGLMRYVPNDRNSGWHAVCVYGYHPEKTLPIQPKKSIDRPKGRTKPQPMIFIRNSWSTSWGSRVGGKFSQKCSGNGFMKVSDLKTMFALDHAYFHAPLTRKFVNLSAELKKHPDPTVP